MYTYLKSKYIYRIFGAVVQLQCSLQIPIPLSHTRQLGLQVIGIAAGKLKALALRSKANIARHPFEYQITNNKTAVIIKFHNKIVVVVHYVD